MRVRYLEVGSAWAEMSRLGALRDTGVQQRRRIAYGVWGIIYIYIYI